MVVRLGVVLGVLASLAEAARAMALLGTTEAMNLGEGASSGLGCTARENTLPGPGVLWPTVWRYCIASP